jgi:hypothetical protein
MIADNPSRSADAPSASGSIIASALSSFDARLRALERPERKSRLKRIQSNASFVALLIGILLSSISLFDVFWSQPREALIRDMEEFNKSVNAVANLRQNVLQVEFQSKDPELTFSMNSWATPQVLANIQYATTLLPRLGDRAGIPQLLVLISEAMNIYDWKSAEILVDRALSARDALPSMRAEALRYKARLMFLTKRPREGRVAYEEALSALRQESGFGINGSRAYIAGDWAVAEFSLGECSVGSERVRQFIQFTAHPQIMPASRAGLVASLKSQLQSVPARCPFPGELATLQ